MDRDPHHRPLDHRALVKRFSERVALEPGDPRPQPDVHRRRVLRLQRAHRVEHRGDRRLRRSSRPWRASRARLSSRWREGPHPREGYTRNRTTRVVLARPARSACSGRLASRARPASRRAVSECRPAASVNVRRVVRVRERSDAVTVARAGKREPRGGGRAAHGGERAACGGRRRSGGSVRVRGEAASERAGRDGRGRRGRRRGRRRSASRRGRRGRRRRRGVAVGSPSPRASRSAWRSGVGVAVACRRRRRSPSA